MSDIFLSYAREDSGKAQFLADALAKQGWSVWWDRQISPGKEFDRVIEDEISSAKCVIVLWSGHSVSSSWVRSEAEEGRSRGILIPTIIDECKPPFIFRSIQTVNLISWNGDHGDENYQDLPRAISRLLTGVQTLPSLAIPAGTKPKCDGLLGTPPSYLSVQREREGPGFARTLDVYVDGQRIGGLAAGQVRRFPVAAGQHSVYVKMDWGASAPVILTVGSGETVRLVCGSPLRGWRMSFAVFFLFSWARWWYISEEDR